jgi:hypothetical protein
MTYLIYRLTEETPLQEYDNLTWIRENQTLEEVPGLSQFYQLHFCTF